MGVINTSIDLAVFNAVIILFDLGTYFASVISTTTALTFSYFANSQFVFKSDRSRTNAALFLFITLFGLWVIHSSAAALIDSALAGVTFFEDQEAIRRNFAKLVATGVSMLWNYFAYKHVVFTAPTTKEGDSDQQKETN